MQLLFVHADHLEFEAVTEAGEDLAETDGVPMEGWMDDCVTVFASVEREDEADTDADAQRPPSEWKLAFPDGETRTPVEGKDDNSLTVTVRSEETERKMDFETLQATVLDDVDDLPKKQRYLPKRVSEQPNFTGR